MSPFEIDYRNLDDVIKFTKALNTKYPDHKSIVIREWDKDNFNIAFVAPENGYVAWPVSLAWVREQLINTHGKIFSVRFLKRTTGEIREMTCRTEVKSHLASSPTKPGLDFRAYRLVNVFDIQKEEYRAIPLEGVLGFKIEGKTYEVRIEPSLG